MTFKRGAGNRFVLLCQSRNAIGKLMKTYLHRPIEILSLLNTGDFQNIFTFSKIHYLQATLHI